MKGIHEINAYTVRNGMGEAMEILLTATVLHKGWGSDSEAWLVRMKNNTVKAFTTDHGALTPLKPRDLNTMIINTERSLSELQLLREQLGG